jgi:ArsR family transcriptional regulator, arsenate/arsenite/antimonite-responsive transcriptional repressor
MFVDAMTTMAQVSKNVNALYAGGMTPVELPRADTPCCAPLATAPLSADDAVVLSGRLKALADPARLRLMSLVLASPGQEACVCDLTEPVGLSQPTVSHHLRLLVEAGLLDREKRGRWSYYRAVPGALGALATVLDGAVRDEGALGPVGAA